MTEKAQALKAQIDDRLKYLAEATDAAAKSAVLRTWLESCAKFYNYSINNLWLIALQNPNATRVAGFNAWKKHNRFVRKGEHGIAILAPCLYYPKKGEPPAESIDDDTHARPAAPGALRGFKTAFVFDVSQTEGEPLPEPPEWRSLARDQELQNRLAEYARSLGIQILIDAIHAQGSTDGATIRLRPDAGTKTLIHELAHCLLNHVETLATIDRSTAELEAEATAYVVAAHFCLPDLASPNYLAIWDADTKKIAARMDRIRKCAADIITAIDPPTPADDLN